MAIKVQKLLPSAATSSASLGGDSQNKILAIKTSVIKIENVLKGTIAYEKKQNDNRRKEQEDKKFKDKENQLEKKKIKSDFKINLPSLPKMGFFDWIRNFVTNVLVGYFVVKFIKYLPKLQGVLDLAGKAFNGVIDIGGKMLNGLATFIEWGYKAYDATRGFLRNFGGDNTLKLFDQFTSGLDTFLTLVLGYNALSGGLDLIGPALRGIGAAAGLGGVAGGAGKVLSQKQIQTYLQKFGSNFAKTQARTRSQKQQVDSILSIVEEARQKKLQKVAGTRTIGGMSEDEVKTLDRLRRTSSPTQQQNLQQKLNKSKFIKKGNIVVTPDGYLISRGTPSSVTEEEFFEKRITKALKPKTVRVSTQALKGGAQQASKLGLLKSVRPFLTKFKFPIIGALIDFGLSVALGEDPGRAAFKSIGAGLLGGVGTALGGGIGLAGGPLAVVGATLGGIAGGTLGDIAGGAIYDLFFGNKASAATNKFQGRAEGGPVTRSGKSVGGPPTRGLRRERVKRTIGEEPQPTQFKPGSGVGGDKAIKKMFPEPEAKDRNKKINPYGYVQDNYKILSDVSFFGPLFGIAIKTLTGDEPKSNDYRNASIGLSNWMISSFGSVGMPGYANGGIIKSGVFTAPEELTKAVEKSLEERISGEVDKAINDLRRRLGLEPLEGKGTEAPGATTPTEGEVAFGTVARGQLTIEQLVGLAKGAGFSQSDAVLMAAVAMAESSGNSLSQRTDTDVHGLWQIRFPVHIDKLKKLGITSRDQLYDPAANAAAAKAVYDSQGISAWSAYTDGNYKKYLSSAQAAAGSPAITVYRMKTAEGKGGYKPSKPGLFNVIQYITGDPSQGGNYDYDGHGTPGNYHDHIAFATAADKERAKAALRAAGIEIGSEYRPGDPGYHGAGLAIDVPGYQWGGSGSIGQKEYAGSAKVRQVLGLFGGGPTGKGGLTMTHPGEYIVDKDSVNAFGQSFFEIINQVENSTQRANASIKLMNILKNYIPGYDPRAEQTIYIPVPQPQMIPVPIPIGGSGGGIIQQSSTSGGRTDILNSGS